MFCYGNNNEEPFSFSSFDFCFRTLFPGAISTYHYTNGYTIISIESNTVTFKLLFCSNFKNVLIISDI